MNNLIVQVDEQVGGGFCRIVSDDEEFLKQACKVLDPSHGRLALLGYSICSLISSPKLNTFVALSLS